MDFETIKFISLLNQLQKKVKMAIFHFQKQQPKTKTAFYTMMKAHIVTVIPLYATLV